MERITHSTRLVDANGSGRDGFTEGTPGVTPATVVPASWLNGAQEEIARAIEGSGATLDGGDNTQLLSAIRTLIVGTVGVANWTLRDPAGGISQTLAGVASDGAGTIVVVGGSDTVQTSTDGGATWTARSADTAGAGSFQEVAYGGGVFVMIGTGGEVQSSADGVTWVLHTAGASVGFGIAYGAGLFLTTWSSGALYTSPDGATWTSRTGVSATAAGAGYGGGLFVTVGDSGAIQTSPNGIDWTARTADGSFAGILRCHAYGNGLHVIGGDSGEVQTSPDGITWTHRETPVTANIQSIAFGNGVFVACSRASNEIISSHDGITWTKTVAPTPLADDLECVGFDGGGFIVVGENGAILTSLRAMV